MGAFAGGFLQGIQPGMKKKRGNKKSKGAKTDAIKKPPGGGKGDDETPSAGFGTFKKGGKVKKTGIYKLHKGEVVKPVKKKKKKVGKSSKLGESPKPAKTGLKRGKKRMTKQYGCK